MSEVDSPSVEARTFLPENLCISDRPNVPARRECHFSEKRVLKVSFFSNSNVPHGSSLPWDLQITANLLVNMQVKNR